MWHVSSRSGVATLRTAIDLLLLLLLTGDGESEDVAGASVMVECRTEALCRDERLHQVAHHVDLRLFLSLRPYTQ